MAPVIQLRGLRHLCVCGALDFEQGVRQPYEFDVDIHAGDLGALQDFELFGVGFDVTAHDAADGDLAPGDLEIADGTVSVAGTPARSMGVDEVAGAATFVHG